MTGFTNPDQFTSFLQSYVTNEAYYMYHGKNVVAYGGFTNEQPQTCHLSLHSM
jgi:hypothetical protein